MLSFIRILATEAHFFSWLRRALAIPCHSMSSPSPSPGGPGYGPYGHVRRLFLRASCTFILRNEQGNCSEESGQSSEESEECCAWCTRPPLKVAERCLKCVEKRIFSNVGRCEVQYDSCNLWFFEKSGVGSINLLGRYCAWHGTWFCFFAKYTAPFPYILLLYRRTNT